MKNVFILVSIFLIPINCYALLIAIPGNETLRKENYTAWPGLVDAINDESRVLLTWFNGKIAASYTGDTASANRVLNEFAETKAVKRELIILPGIGHPITHPKQSVVIDYQIRVAQGNVQGMIQRGELFRAHDTHPTMKIYLTENINLQDIEIPDGLIVTQLYDLEKRYESFMKNGNPRIHQSAERAVESLHKNFRCQGEDFKLLEKQIAEIETFVDLYRKNNPPE